MVMKRYEGNPILAPIEDSSWESVMVYKLCSYFTKAVRCIYFTEPRLLRTVSLVLGTLQVKMDTP